MEQPPPTAALRESWRMHLGIIREDARQPRPVPRGQGRLALVRYGLAQPFLGLRTIFASRDLLGISLAPAFGVLIIAVVVGWMTGSEHGVLRGLLASLLAVAALAPLPALLFGRVYAHLAAKARGHLGLPPQQPYIRGVMQLVGEWLAQVVVLALGVLPLTAVLGIVPWVGAMAAFGVQATWALHWVVVEGYDNARTLPPGRTIEQLEAESLSRQGRPWFDRIPHAVSKPRGLMWLMGPVRMLSEIVASLSRPWRLEVDLVEDEPWVSLGFGLGAAAMLAVPGLNLLFRPAVVVAGVHLRHRLIDEPAASRSSASISGSTQPYPAVPIA